MKLQLRNIFPILLFTASLVLSGCFEKKKEEVVETPSTDGGGSVTPPSNNYGYVTLTYPTVSGTYRTGFHADAFPETFAVSNIASGVSLTNFTISPSLPFGLSMDSATGTISGTVFGAWSNQNYTISAQKPDSEGAVTAQVNFGISSNGTPVDTSTDYSDLRYSQAEVTLIVGQPMTPLTLTYSGPQDKTFFSTDGFSFQPMFNEIGLNFDNATGTITGTPTNPVNKRVFAVYDGGLSGGVTITIIEGAPTNLHYTDETVTYPVGYAITQNTPSASGGNVASYSVSLALPAGLALDTTTGIITGTPTTVASASNHTITATNIAGSTTRQISITVALSAPAALSYVSVSSRYTVGASITANTPIITGGGQPSSYSVNPALSSGLTLDTTTGVITGLPTVMTAAASYTVTATNATGSANKVIGINVVNPGSHVLYAANGSTLKAYSVDEVTGEPIFIGKQISSDVYSKLKFHPTADCAIGHSSGSISSFSINKSAHGELTLATSAGGLSGAQNIVMSADGKFVFVLNNQDPLTQFIKKFEVNPTNCTLSNTSSFSVQYSTVYFVRDLALAGNNIYVNYHSGSGKIRHLKFDSNGDLTFQADYTGGGDRYITANADGSKIYSTFEQSIKAYSVDGLGDLSEDYNSGDGSILMSASVQPVMDTASDRFIMAIRNGFNQFGVKYVGFAVDGTINAAAKLEGPDVTQYYSQWQSVSAHTSQTGTYIYSSFQPSLPNGAPISSVRLKIESNGAITPQGLGLVGHISGY